MILAPGKNKDLLATLVEFGYAEYGSALEMLAAAKSTESPKAKIGYINHALDEYRHAALILLAQPLLTHRSLFPMPSSPCNSSELGQF